MEYCNIFIAEYQYNQYNNNIIVPSAGQDMPGKGVQCFSLLYFIDLLILLSHGQLLKRGCL